MEWHMYDEWIDIPLYRQMVDMVYRLSAREDKVQRVREIRRYALFAGEANKTLEDAYSLRYPGEVLERLGEHIKITERQIRALGLALAQTKPLQDENMFVGNQFPSFWKKMGSGAAKNDLYMLAGCYLMEEGPKRELYQDFLEYPFGDIAELLFALSILPEDQTLWGKIKGKLNRVLGVERVISVYENVEVYCWLIQTFHWRLNGYRKKDLDALKYVMRLPFANACNPGTLQKKLVENGYSIPEIYFLNFSLLRYTNLPGMVDIRSITAERMAVEICGFFLGGQEEYPDAAYDLCRYLLAEYKRLKIKINGWGEILEGLSQTVKIQNVKSYQVVYTYRDSSLPRQEWLYIDLTDGKWDSLYGWLEEEAFDTYATMALVGKNYNGDEICRFLTHYQELTGKDYQRFFWIKEERVLYKVFHKLAECAIVRPELLIEEYLNEFHLDAGRAAIKWKNMVYYLRAYVEEMQSEKAYYILEKMVNEFGITDDHMLFPVKKMLRQLSGVSIWNNKFTHMKMIWVFLDARQHQKLFGWIEKVVFQEQPEDYVRFLTAVLEDREYLLWLPEKAAREVYRKVLPFVDNPHHEMKLREIYQTPEEIAAYQEKKKLMAERKRMKAEMERIREKKKQFSVLVTKSKGTGSHFTEIRNFLGYGYRGAEHRIVAAYLSDVFTKETVRICSLEEKENVMKIIGTLYAGGLLALETVKKIVNQMEEIENAGADSKAS